ncbi:MAG TPA: Lsr2 family protein [Pseudonocardiaceae bacterium]|nr:Lsr2 family protein [Pseudonocardiaceae bacterium]
MARKVLVRLVDDLDGSPSADVAPVTFALDGVTYQIDLNQRNAGRLRESLAAFVASARRTSGRAKRGTAVRAGRGGASGDVSAIREWAKEQGLPVSARGRIPANILDAYNSSNGAAESAPRATRTRTAAAAKSAPTATAPARRGRPAGKPAASKAAPKTAPKTAPKAAAKAAPKATRATKSAAATKSTAAKASTRTTRTAAKTTAKAATTRTRATAAKPAAAKATRGAAKTAKAATPAPRRAVARKAKG